MRCAAMAASRDTGGVDRPTRLASWRRTCSRPSCSPCSRKQKATTRSYRMPVEIISKPEEMCCTPVRTRSRALRRVKCSSLTFRCRSLGGTRLLQCKGHAHADQGRGCQTSGYAEPFVVVSTPAPVNRPAARPAYARCPSHCIARPVHRLAGRLAPVACCQHDLAELATVEILRGAIGEPPASREWVLARRAL